MQKYEKKNFPQERDLYGVHGVELIECTFDGIEDGESALKEASDVKLKRCYMNLRYPLWHDVGVVIEESVMTENCRAALWYSEDITIKDSELGGIKALRECKRINIIGTRVKSPEFGWRSEDITISGGSIEGEYPFLMAKGLKLNGLKLNGKYSFQYVENVEISGCDFATKDAFWHAKNVTVKDSVIKGEYLGWYSENLTFINCKIIGTQPLCYCKGLVLKNCTTEDTDLAFEYSDVDAEIIGEVLSVKNPRSGRICAGSIGELIYTDDSKYPAEAKIIVNGVIVDKRVLK